MVQGVGFRPHVYALAKAHGLAGEVWNSPAGLVAEVEGIPTDVDAFCRELETAPPPLAVVESMTFADLPLQGGTEFAIRTSRSGTGRTFVSPDVAICDDCLAELGDPGRSPVTGTPFITCTNCGPRFTVITALPYDRPTTTMAGFPMCAACAAASTPTQRTAASTPRRSACPDCGPRLRMVRQRR